MALINLDLIGAYAINPGYAWTMKVRYPGNVLGSSIRGKISEDYDAPGFTAFQLGISTYNREDDYTEFPLKLSRRQTLDIPLTGSGHWIYGVVFSRIGQDDLLLLAGKVHSIPAIEM